MTHIENKIVRLLILLLLAFVGGTDAFADKLYKLVKVAKVEVNGLYVFEQKGRVMNDTVISSALQTTSSWDDRRLTGKESYVWKVQKRYWQHNETAPSGKHGAS